MRGKVKRKLNVRIEGGGLGLCKLQYRAVSQHRRIVPFRSRMELVQPQTWSWMKASSWQAFQIAGKAGVGNEEV